MSIVKRNTYQLSSSKELRLPRTIFLVNIPFCNACSNGILCGIHDSKGEEEYKARTPNIGNTRTMMANRSRICPQSTQLSGLGEVGGEISSKLCWCPGEICGMDAMLDRPGSAIPSLGLGARTRPFHTAVARLEDCSFC
jgi:hypothetical protein